MQLLKMPSDIAPFITLKSNNIDLIGEVETALYKLEKLTTGRNLLNKLKELVGKGKAITIYADTSIKNIATPEMSESQIEKYRLRNTSPDNKLLAMAFELCTKRSRGQKKEGVNANVYFNPMQARKIDKYGAPVKSEFHFDNHFTLGHILIHAMRIMKGNYQGGMMDNFNPNNPHQQREELRAFGLGEFYQRPISENKMREESGLLPYLSLRSDF